jgi:hypothetical protein
MEERKKEGGLEVGDEMKAELISSPLVSEIELLFFFFLLPSSSHLSSPFLLRIS